MKKLSMIFLLALVLVGCSSMNDEISSNNGKEAIHDTEWNKADNLIVDSFDTYGLDYILTGLWEDATLYRGGQNTGSRMHDFFNELDKEYFTLIVRSPVWTVDAPCQDLVFDVFRVEEWNNNINEDNFNSVPEIVSYSQGYVLVIDPDNYHLDVKDYDQAIAAIYDNYYGEFDVGAYRELGMVSFETEKVMYASDVANILVKWRNILDDTMMTTGVYIIEKKTNKDWEIVHIFEKEDLSNPNIYKIIKKEAQWISYDVEDLALDDGEYRLGIEFERLSLLGLELGSAGSYIYRSFGEFKIGSEEISRVNLGGAGMGLPGVSLETEYEIYEKGSKIIKAKWTNTLDDEIMYGKYFTLEKYEDGTWQGLQTSGEVAFESIGYSLESKSEKWQEFNVSIYTKYLSEGEYRICTDFIRETLNGVDFEAGNYPKYQIYSNFSVDDSSMTRNMTSLYDDRFAYKLDDYGIVVYFPMDWEGVLLSEEEQDDKSPMHELLHEVDSGYSIIRLSHPVIEEYQDLVLGVINRNAWNANVAAAVGDDFDLLPERVHSEEDMLLVIDPYQYDEDRDGYEEIRDVIKNWIKGY